MDQPALLRQLKEKIAKTLALWQEELRAVRGARAEVGLVDSLQVEAYGRRLALKELATITVPEPQQIVIVPWDQTIAAAIEAALRNSPLGLAPVREAALIRLSIPPLTAERREELARVLRTKGEEAKVALRNLRHESLREIKRLMLGEDDEKRIIKEIQEEIDLANHQVEESVERKINEIKGS